MGNHQHHVVPWIPEWLLLPHPWDRRDKEREKVPDLGGRQVGMGLGRGQDRSCDLRTEQVMDSLR